MRTLVMAAAFVMCSTLGSAQQAAKEVPSPRLFAAAGDVTAMIAKAKAERKPDQPNFVQPILRLAPYTANLEHRIAGPNAAASVHEKAAEMFYVIEGSGTIVTGGTLREERRTNADNRTGTGIDGGARRRISNGDFIMVPENTPHWFGEIDGTLVLMSIHLPKGH